MTCVDNQSFTKPASNEKGIALRRCCGANQDDLPFDSCVMAIAASLASWRKVEAFHRC